ncbi:MAG: hypothetical protein VKQ33_10005 [Candidatus Sericytochromatia bacterium]|nr:hypothetical protein [Candidatus Sericytochromatia bacterium]
MAASLSPPLIAPSVLIPAATGLALVAGVALAWQTHGTGRRGVSGSLALVAGVVAGLLTLAWASLGPERLAPPAGGALVGGLLALAGLRGGGAERPGRELAVLLLGVAGLGVATHLVAPRADLANAIIGALAALALGRLALAAASGAAVAAGALAPLALLGGLVAWGDRLVPDGSLGVPLALGAGLALAGAAGVAARAVPRQPALAAGGLGLAGAWVLLAGLFQLPVAWWACAALGAVGGAGLATGLAGPGPWERLGRVVAAIGGGLLMVVDARLAGVVGVALGGLGLATVGAALPPAHRARSWVLLLATVFAVRVWLQLFLDRVALTGYGVDLTHPYATAALLAGALFPTLVAASTRAWWGRPVAAMAALAVAAAAPVLLGYFLHLEALGAWLVGLVAAAFVGGLGGPSAEADGEPERLGGLLVGQAAVALLAAPWLVVVMNATRGERLLGLAAVTLAVAVALALAWPRPAAPQAPVEA